MTCFHSKPVWQSEPGKPLEFQWRQDRPPEFFIDCGKCEGCRARQRRDWAVRMAHESQDWERNSFLTLTYDDFHCPEELDKHAVQTFLKRLRKRSNRQIRYFITGEYGDKTHRPHYHAIIFNEDFRDGRFTYTINEKLWGNKTLDNLWGMGTVAVSDFTFSTAMYVAGYTAKKIGNQDTFTIQSRKPPIGQNWLRKHYDNIQRLETVVIEGKEVPIPRVYHEWVKGEENFRAIKERLSQKVQTLNDQKLRSKKYNHLARSQLRNEKL